MNHWSDVDDGNSRLIRFECYWIDRLSIQEGPDLLSKLVHPHKMGLLNLLCKLYPVCRGNTGLLRPPALACELVGAAVEDVDGDFVVPWD